MKNFSLTVAALIAGFVGGYVGSQSSRIFTPSSRRVIRASSFELLDKSDNVVGVWGIDNSNNTLLSFKAPKVRSTTIGAPATAGNPQGVLFLGVLADGSPRFGVMGTDGKPRVTLALTLYEKPVLLLGDEKSTRLFLGQKSSDAPQPTDDDWAVEFYPPREMSESITSIGTLVKEKHLDGYIELNGEPFVTSLSTSKAKMRIH